MKNGACESTVNLVNDPRFNHRLNVVSGVLENECSLLLKQFSWKNVGMIDPTAETAGHISVEDG